MENRDYQEIGDWLAERRKAIADFQNLDYTHWRSIEFERWCREVIRYMKVAGPYGADRVVLFMNGMNSQILDVYTDKAHLDKQWQRSLAYAYDEIGHVIENIERDWKPEEKPARPGASPGIAITNNNIQVNSLTVGNVLEHLAEQIEPKAPEEESWLRRILKNSTFKDYVGMGMDAFAKAVLEAAKSEWARGHTKPAVRHTVTLAAESVLLLTRV